MGQIGAERITSNRDPVDGNGSVWVCGGETARLIPVTNTWSLVDLGVGSVGYAGGCMVDGEAGLWRYVADTPTQTVFTMVGVDVETLAIVEEIPLPRHTYGGASTSTGNSGGSRSRRTLVPTGSIPTPRKSIRSTIYRIRTRTLT